MAFADPTKILSAFGLEPGMHVADFGAGTGFYTAAVSDMVGENGVVYAIEIQQELLTKARSMIGNDHSNVEFLLGDLEAKSGSQLAAGSVDAVILSNVLFQCEDKEAAIREAARVLKPRGRILCIDWADSYGGLGPQPEHIVPADKAKEMFAQAGLVFDRDIEAGDHHWGVVLHKK